MLSVFFTNFCPLLSFETFYFKPTYFWAKIPYVYGQNNYQWLTVQWYTTTAAVEKLTNAIWVHIEDAFCSSKHQLGEILILLQSLFLWLVFFFFSIAFLWLVFFLTFPVDFWIPIIFSGFNYNCSNIVHRSDKSSESS